MLTDLQAENSVKTESDELVGNDGKSPKARIGAVKSRQVMSRDRPRKMQNATKERRLTAGSSFGTLKGLPSHVASDHFVSQANV